jgi:hypothetical protein
MIVPTIGRVVLVFNRHGNPLKQHPEAGLVAFVHNNRLINIGGFDHHGMPFAITSLRLMQEGDVADGGEVHAEWMQYQKDTASGKIPPTLHATPEPK